MFEEVKVSEANALLRSRRLGYSQIRLLPKGAKLRPIMNLRRRVLRLGPSKTLGPSINSVLAPVHTMLKFETVACPCCHKRFWANADYLSRTRIPVGLDPPCSLSASCILD